jgi:hypothetical protein
MERKSLAILILAIGLLGLAYYVISPYLFVSGWASDLKSGDALAISEKIDFPVLRESLKGQLTAMFTQKMTSDPSQKDNPFAAVGTMFVGAIIDQMLDSYCTADGIVRLAQAQEAKQPKGLWNGSDVSQLMSEISLESPTVFLIKTPNVTAFAKWTGFGWKIVRIEIPDQVFAEVAQHPAVSQSH